MRVSASPHQAERPDPPCFSFLTATGLAGYGASSFCIGILAFSWPIPMGEASSSRHCREDGSCTRWLYAAGRAATFSVQTCQRMHR